MTRKYILVDRVPVEVDLFAWAQWFETAREERMVDATKLPGKVNVSTVFVGIDHNFSGNGPPLIFETMIFGGPHDGYLDRCSTWAQAVTMHRSMCALARLGMTQPAGQE